MNTRLLTGAVGIALCLLAAPAGARPYFDDDPSRGYGYGYRHDNRQDSEPAESSDRKGRQKAAKRGARRSAAKPGRRAGVAARGVTGYARGAGASRACLTSSARALLGRIESRFGAVQIISTCRPGARVAGTGRVSKHASGEAIDFNAGGRKGQIVRWLIANHKSGGTMTYAGMSHVHVDVGYPFVALNAGGRRRR